MALDGSRVIVRICGRAGSQSSGAHRGIDERGHRTKRPHRPDRIALEKCAAGTRMVEPHYGSVRPSVDPCQPALKTGPLFGFTLGAIDEEVASPAIPSLDAQPGGRLSDVPSNEPNRHRVT
jgi:hypothetical protein